MNGREGHTTIPFGPLIAAIGAVMLLVSLFLNWYEGLTAFTVFELVDIVLVVCALLIVLQLAGGMGLMKPPASPVVSLLVALFALGDVLPHLRLAVAGTVLMATGAFLATANISLSIEPREHEPTRVDHDAETVREPARPAAARDDEPPATP